MTKRYYLSILIIFLSSCSSFGAVPQLPPALTTFPSRTPIIVTATPVIIAPGTNTQSPIEVTLTASVIATTATAIETATSTATTAPIQSAQVDILGCDTSIDILHGMGEVTNAYVTVKNTGNIDLPNTCSLLRALDEDREHPDKKACISSLPAQHQVTFKLTVDSAYRQETIIQVDTSSDDILILRVDKQSCKDIGLFGGAPDDVGIIKAIQ